MKVLLPGSVVRAMDSRIEASDDYAGRSEFILDAIQGHLAELEVSRDVGGSGREHPAPPANRQREQPQGDPSSWAAGTLPHLDGDVPTVERTSAPPTTPTWGMHNRDFPTLWAAALLGQETQMADGPISFETWLRDVVARAWELPRILNGKHFDTSGFPTNEDKKDASENRFVRFFVGDETESGPMFELGLAAVGDEGTALTSAGSRLLVQLQGFGCRVESEVRQEWTHAFLDHLARWGPADLEFLSEILHNIDEGHSDRTELVRAVEANHPDWSEAVAGTNVAGYIARAREWGLLARRQQDGHYVLEPAAIGTVEAAVARSRSTGEDER